MSYTYHYIFITSMLDKYEFLIQEAKTIEARKFAVEQWKFYNEKYKNLNL